MAFTAFILIKLRNAEQHCVVIVCARFHQNGREIQKVWVEINLFVCSSVIVTKFIATDVVLAHTLFVNCFLLNRVSRMRR